MNDRRTWLIDFDETLASSGLTWAFQYAFPKFIRENQLQFDTQQLEAVIMNLQQRSNQNPDPAPLMRELFETMGWPSHLQERLAADLWSNYLPELFPDAVPFLERLRARQDRIFVVSNSPRTPDQITRLGLDTYVQQVFTPHICPDTKPKPHRSLWEYIVAREIDLHPEHVTVVGDDPWADGGFAEGCGLQCWIIDRMNRFASMRGEKPFRWAQSLEEIPV